MKNVRILLADDHTLVRQGLRKILEEHPGSRSSARPATVAKP